MYFDDLPNEILGQIFLHLPDISSVLSLSATCHRCHAAYHSSKKLAILSDAADAEYGPIDEIVQLVTHNASQPAHLRRAVPWSEALLHQIVKVGRVAVRYEELYTFKKWKTDYAARRLLTVDERRRCRRAVYRLWLFTRAFHTAAQPRTCRAVPAVMRERAALLQNFATEELAEMLDVHVYVLRDLVANNLCPSNGKIRRGFAKRFPESSQQVLFSYSYTSPYYPSMSGGFALGQNGGGGGGWADGGGGCASRLTPSRWHEPGAEGWGDDISHYYVVEDMMKLDPEQMLYLRDRCPLKSQVEAVVRSLGDWFVNNGETFSETLNFVMKQRGLDLEELKLAIEEGVAGVACTEEYESI